MSTVFGHTSNQATVGAATVQNPSMLDNVTADDFGGGADEVDAVQQQVQEALNKHNLKQVEKTIAGSPLTGDDTAASSAFTASAPITSLPGSFTDDASTAESKMEESTSTGAEIPHPLTADEAAVDAPMPSFDPPVATVAPVGPEVDSMSGPIEPPSGPVQPPTAIGQQQADNDDASASDDVPEPLVDTVDPASTALIPEPITADTPTPEPSDDQQAPSEQVSREANTVQPLADTVEETIVLADETSTQPIADVPEAPVVQVAEDTEQHGTESVSEPVPEFVQDEVAVETTPDPVVVTDEEDTDGKTIEDIEKIVAPSKAVPAVDAEKLAGMKQHALDHLEPLVGDLDQTPAEEFKTTMMMIQANDNHTLLDKALAAAKKIEDSSARAKALLDIVNEINYFSQSHTS